MDGSPVRLHGALNAGLPVHASPSGAVSVVDGQPADEKDLISFCKEHLASYKKPRSVEFVDELPKNNNGKILKKELRARYWEDQERKV